MSSDGVIAAVIAAVFASITFSCALSSATGMHSMGRGFLLKSSAPKRSTMDGRSAKRMA